jgi:glucans biosynthesis protein C
MYDSRQSISIAAELEPLSMVNVSSERLHALDAARAAALLLGIVFHATMSFLPLKAPMAAVMDSQHSLFLAGLFHVLHTFRMATFFLLAGFFGHMSLHKKGLRAFVADRLKRIGIPLVVGWPILFGAIVAITIWGADVMARGGPLQLPSAFPKLPAFPLTHLWFLYVLLWLYAATLLLHGLLVLVDRHGRLRVRLDGVVRWLVENPFGCVALALPLAFTLYFAPPWLAWFGIDTPNMSLIPNAGAVVAFFSAFAFGWLMHRQVNLLDVWKRRWFSNLALSIALTAASFAIIGVAPVETPASQDAATALYAACFTLSVWTWSFALIGLCLKFLSRHSLARRYVADAAYWLYLVHLPLVMALQVSLSQLAWPWWVKFPMIQAITFPILFVSYHLFVRYSFIGTILNGRREMPRGRSKTSPPSLPEAAA